MAWVAIGSIEEFPDGGGRLVRCGDVSLAVFRLDGELFALENRCPHRGFPLHDGTIDTTRVRCRTHGSCFDLRSGAVERGPARRGIATYRVDVTDGQARIELPD